MRSARPIVHFMIRVRRNGAVVPARLWWCDYEIGEPDNILDRGRLSPYPRVDIAGEEVPPERLLDRFDAYQPTGDLVPPAAVVWRMFDVPNPYRCEARDHWKAAVMITEEEYEFQIQHLRWAEKNRPNDPRLNPRRPVDPATMPLPNFDKENSI